MKEREGMKEREMEERERGTHEVERRCEVLVGHEKIREHYWMLNWRVCRSPKIVLGWMYGDRS